MKKCLFALTILFSIATFIGAGYVLLNHGTVSAGYACVPMAFATMFLTLYGRK